MSTSAGSYMDVQMHPATWVRENFLPQCYPFIVLEQKNMIKYCAPICQNWIWKILKGFTLGFNRTTEVVMENEEQEEMAFTQNS